MMTTNKQETAEKGSIEIKNSKCRATIRWQPKKEQSSISARIFDDLINNGLVAEHDQTVPILDKVFFEAFLHKFEEKVIRNLTRDDPRNDIYLNVLDTLKKKVRRLFY